MTFSYLALSPVQNGIQKLVFSCHISLVHFNLEGSVSRTPLKLSLTVILSWLEKCPYGKNVREVICAPLGLPGGSDGKESAGSAGDLGSIPGLGRSPRKENGYPLRYSCLENSMDTGAWQDTVHGVAKSRT